MSLLWCSNVGGNAFVVLFMLSLSVSFLAVQMLFCCCCVFIFAFLRWCLVLHYVSWMRLLHHAVHSYLYRPHSKLSHTKHIADITNLETNGSF